MMKRTSRRFAFLSLLLLQLILVSVSLVILHGECLPHLELEEDEISEYLFLQRLGLDRGVTSAIGFEGGHPFPVLARLDVHMSTVATDPCEPLRDGSRVGDSSSDDITDGGCPQRSYNFDVFPKQVGKLLIESKSVESFTATLVQGKWKHLRWGPPPIDVFPNGGTFIAKILGTNDESQLDATWNVLIHSLGGLMCASFGQLKDSRRYSALPTMGRWESTAFWASGHADGASVGPAGNSTASRVMYGTLPVEPVCTENLTPWAKLLPCRLEAGLARLVDPVPLAESEFKILRISASQRRTESGRIVLNAVASLSVVLPSSQQLSTNDDHASAFQRLEKPRNCFACKRSLIFLRLPNEQPVDPRRIATYTAENDSRVDTFDATDTDVAMSLFGINSTAPPLTLSSLHYVPRGKHTADSHKDIEIWRDEVVSLIDKFSSARTRSSWIVRIRNGNPIENRTFSYYDGLPSFMKPLLHTLTVVLKSNIDVDTNNDSKHDTRNDGYATSEGDASVASTQILHQSAGPSALRDFGISWQPTSGTNLSSVFYIESFVLPPQTSLTLRFDILKAHMHHSMFGFSPDKGEDIGSAVLLYEPESYFKWETFLRLRLHHASNENVIPHDPLRVDNKNSYTSFTLTDGLIVLVPLPDFSMPFNVVAFTCTALLLFLGSTFRLTIVKRRAHDKFDKYRIAQAEMKRGTNEKTLEQRDTNEKTPEQRDTNDKTPEQRDTNDKTPEQKTEAERQCQGGYCLRKRKH